MEAAKNIWLSTKLPVETLSRLILKGNPDYAVNSSFKLGIAAQATIGLSGLAAAQLHALRTGINQDVVVDARHAVLQFHSEALYTVDGKAPANSLWDSIAGVYKTKNGGFARIHTNFPHHRRGVLSILNIPEEPPPTKKEVSEAILKWDAVELETEAAFKGMCVTAFRSSTHWDQHPQAKALLGTPPVTITKIGDAPRRQVSGNPSRPLEGIRILDLTRVIAGPVAGRTLAAHGADILLVTSPNLPALPFLDVETSLGKRTTQLDLTLPTDVDTLRTLAKESDVFLQGYRPGGLESKGFGTSELINLRPGIVCANLTAWGWEGPWKSRRGFDSLVQTATGFNAAEDEAYREFEKLDRDVVPKVLPMQALDHAAGYFLAFGVNAALCKTITEGGSWEVKVSLAAVGQWIRSLGRLSPAEAFGRGLPYPSMGLPQDPEITNLSTTWRRGLTNDKESRTGPREITAIKQAALLSVTPVREGESSEAPVILNAHSPTWLPR